MLRGEKQSTAADIWSLGVIALLLVSGCGLAGITGLARLDQGALRIVLHNLLDSNQEASANARSFALSCMETTASHRITSESADCHDWFHTPTSHLEFFQELDARTAAL